MATIPLLNAPLDVGFGGNTMEGATGHARRPLESPLFSSSLEEGGQKSTRPGSSRPPAPGDARKSRASAPGARQSFPPPRSAGGGDGGGARSARAGRASGGGKRGEEEKMRRTPDAALFPAFIERTQEDVARYNLLTPPLGNADDNCDRDDADLSSGQKQWKLGGTGSSFGLLRAERVVPYISGTGKRSLQTTLQKVSHLPSCPKSAHPLS